MGNSDKVILDLCGGTGSWARPYTEAGYKVITLTLPSHDVRKLFVGHGILHHGDEAIAYVPDIYGILAAPPCTMFSLARTRAKKPRDFNEGMECVEACLKVIWEVRKRNKLAFWAMENPMGYLRQFMGKPPFHFDPWEFGDPYTKGTDIWGYFNFPTKKYKNIDEIMTEEQKARCSTNSRRLPSISEITGSKQAAKRSVTPKGFAVAFFKANK